MILIVIASHQTMCMVFFLTFTNACLSSALNKLYTCIVSNQLEMVCILTFKIFFSRFVRNLTKLTVMYCRKPIDIAIGYAQVLIPQNKSIFEKYKKNREEIKCKNKFSWKLVKNKFT